MKKMNLATVLFTLLSFYSYSQEDTLVVEVEDTIVKNWHSSSLFGLNGTQSSFVNWNAGGRNNLSFLGFINASATFSKNKIKWDNNMSLAFGGVKYIGVGSSSSVFEKTDDKIDVSSRIGYKLKDKLYLTFLSGFKTQMVDGFQYPDLVRVSTFMAPGYLNLGLGIEWPLSDDFSITLAPANAKFTFVKNQELANAGAFGVRPAEYDITSGDLIREGEDFRAEFGAYFNMKYKKEIAKNINMITNLVLFSNYLDNPQNIDVNADVLFAFKVNDWFSASLNWALKYDHDILIKDINGDIGPRTQFKSVIGLGISYTLKNFK